MIARPPYDSRSGGPREAEALQEACFALTELSEHLRKPPGAFGIVINIMYSRARTGQGQRWS